MMKTQYMSGKLLEIVESVSSWTDFNHNLQKHGYLPANCKHCTVL